MSIASSTVKPSASPMWMIVSRVIPGRIDIESGGVSTLPSFTTKMFSPGPSAT
jgi:hypothetical protein